MSDAPQPNSTAASSVRRNALWAAGAAAFMLWYGFHNVVLVDPSAGELLFVYTLRIGGGAMAISALLSLTGLRVALLFDGVASVLIGLAFLASAGLMYSGGGTQAMLNVLFGVVFLHSGYRNWEDHRATAPPPGAPTPDTDADASTN